MASGVRNTDINFVIEMANHVIVGSMELGPLVTAMTATTEFDFCAVLLCEILAVSKYLQNEYLHTFRVFGAIKSIP